MFRLVFSPDKREVNIHFFSFKVQAYSIWQSLGGREMLNQFGIFLFFFMSRNAAPGSHLCFYNLSSLQHTSVRLYSNHCAERSLMAFKWINWTLFTVILLNSQHHLTQLTTSPFLKFFSLYLDNIIFFLFSLLSSDFLLNVGVPNYTSWPLPSHYAHSFG